MSTEPQDPDEDAYPAYPHTPDEHRDSFLAQVRGVEQQLFALSQDLYQELSPIWDADNPMSHVQALESMKRLFDERISSIRYSDSLSSAAAAADRAWGLATAEPGDS